MSRDMTKQNGMCTQQRLRSAWASAQSDQSSLSARRKLGSLATHWAHSEDSDQTGRMPRLIWVFAGRTCHFVGFVMRWLIFALHVTGGGFDPQTGQKVIRIFSCITILEKITYLISMQLSTTLFP